LLKELESHNNDILKSYVEKIFELEDEESRNIFFICITDFYIKQNKFEDIIKGERNSVFVQRSIINRIIEWLFSEEITDIEINRCKELILIFANYKASDTEQFFSLFYKKENLDKIYDDDFLLSFVKSDAFSSNPYYVFHFFNDSETRIERYKDIVLFACDRAVGLLIQQENMNREWQISSEVNKALNSLSKIPDLNYSCLSIWDKLYEHGLGKINSQD